MAYIDTSVLIPYYHPEPLSAPAQEALEEAEQPTISPLVELEFCSAFAIKARTGELEAEPARRILEALRTHIEEGRYLVVSLTAADFALARQWISRLSTPLRAPDGLHLAAALANDLTLLTADRALAKAAQHFGVKHELVD